LPRPLLYTSSYHLSNAERAVAEQEALLLLLLLLLRLQHF